MALLTVSSQAIQTTLANLVDVPRYEREHLPRPVYRTRWLSLFHRTGLPIEEPARELVTRLGPASAQSLEDRGVALAIRAWTRDTQTWLPDWLTWVRACADSVSWRAIEQFRGPVGGRAAHRTGECEISYKLTTENPHRNTPLSPHRHLIIYITLN